MIVLKYSLRKKFDVNKGASSNWIRNFQGRNDIRVPDGWVSSMEIDGRMVSFSFVNVQGARGVPNGDYVMVIWKWLREEALGGGTQERFYIMPTMAAIRPTQEDTGEKLSAEQYLQQNALAQFTSTERDQWVKEKKLRVA